MPPPRRGSYVGHNVRVKEDIVGSMKPIVETEVTESSKKEPRNIGTTKNLQNLENPDAMNLLNRKQRACDEGAGNKSALIRMRSTFIAANGPPRGGATGMLSTDMRGRESEYMGKYTFKRLWVQNRYRQKLQRIFIMSTASYYMDLVNALLSLTSCTIFVIETYNPDLPYMRDIEFGISMYFIFDYLLRLVLADFPLQKAMEFMMMVDLSTTLPVFIDFLPDDSLINSYGNYLNLLNILRVLRVARMHHLQAYIQSEIVRALFKVVFTVVLLLFATSGIVQIVENDHFCDLYVESDPLELQLPNTENAMRLNLDPDATKLQRPYQCRQYFSDCNKIYETDCGMTQYTFAECMYFCVVTITTVGYGDISPRSSLGMFVVSLFIMSAIVVVPIITSKFVEAMNVQNQFQRDKYVSGKTGHDHVIVCGCMSEKGVRTFFSEFYHEDNSLTEEPYQTVILSSTEPTAEMNELLKSPLEFYITYLQGHCMRDHDLQRASVETAKACFVLASKNSTMTGMEDAMTIMQALNIKRYVSTTKPGTSIFMLIQLLRPENKEHLVGSSTKDLFLLSQISKDEKGKLKDGSNDDSSRSPSLKQASTNHQSMFGKELYLDDTDFVDCIDETKLHLLAKGCICPGLMTLISNLSSSGIEDLIDQERFSYQDAKNAVKRLDLMDEWEREYIKGSSKEIYCVPMSNEYEGLDFMDVCRIIYRVYGLVMLGLEIHPISSKPKIVINPFGFDIPDVYKYHVHAIVIADDRNVAIEALSVHSETGKITIFTDKRGNISRQRMETKHSSPQGNRQSHKKNKIKSKLTMNKIQVRNTASLNKKAGVSKSSGRSGQGTCVAIINNLNSQGIDRINRQDRLSANEFNHEVMDAGFSIEQTANQWKQLRASICRPTSGRYISAISALQQQFHLHTSPMEFKDAIIFSVDQIPDLESNKHRILLTGSLKNLHSFIMPLRTKHLSEAALKPVVILTPDTDGMSQSEWERLAFFPHIYIVDGSPLEAADLIRAGALTAENAVILANEKPAAQMAELDAVLWDADAVFTFQGLVSLNRQLSIQVELMTRQNLVYLNCGVAKTKIDPAAAAGMAYTSAITDRLLAKAFYDNRTTKVLSQMIVGEDIRSEMSQGQDPILAHMPKDSHFFLIPVPQRMCTKFFSEVFDELAKLGILVVAIQRGVWKKLGSGPHGNSFPYVYTNPDPECRVEKCDKLYVLALHSSNDDLHSFVTQSFCNVLTVTSAASAFKKRLSIAPGGGVRKFLKGMHVSNTTSPMDVIADMEENSTEVVSAAERISSRAISKGADIGSNASSVNGDELKAMEHRLTQHMMSFQQDVLNQISQIKGYQDVGNYEAASKVSVTTHAEYTMQRRTTTTGGNGSVANV